MKLIAHRGNVNEIKLDKENTLEYINEAILKQYNVEVDIWFLEKKFFLGHDKPEIEVCYEWLLKQKDHLFIHTKNILAFNEFLKLSGCLKFFFHESERHVPIMNSDLIWTHDLNDIQQNSIIPLLSIADIETYKQSKMKCEPYGICSDFIEILNI